MSPTALKKTQTTLIYFDVYLNTWKIVWKNISQIFNGGTSEEGIELGVSKLL